MIHNPNALRSLLFNIRDFLYFYPLSRLIGIHLYLFILIKLTHAFPSTQKSVFKHFEALRNFLAPLPEKIENEVLFLRLGLSSFSKTLFKLEEFENAGFFVLVWTENILQTEL